jgi:hypothetical protein
LLALLNLHDSKNKKGGQAELCPCLKRHPIVVGFSVGEAETTQGADYPSTEIEAAIRRGGGALGAAVSAEEAEAGRDATFDAKRAAVQRAVVNSAVIA